MKSEEILNIDPKAELRFVHNVEARADEEGKRYIEGIAAVIDKTTVIYDEYEEVVRKGAFDEALTGDIRIVKNHDPNLLLGRSKNGGGTGQVFVNPQGHLAFSVPVRDGRSHSVDTYDEILTADIDGCSFLFRVGEEKWTFPNDTNGRTMPLREIIKFEIIYDVGPVTYPAYEDTSVIARSLTEAKKDHQTPNISQQRKQLFNRKFKQNV